MTRDFINRISKELISDNINILEKYGANIANTIELQHFLAIKQYLESRAASILGIILEMERMYISEYINDFTKKFMAEFEQAKNNSFDEMKKCIKEFEEKIELLILMPKIDRKK